ncbi:uncharacterized protein LOC103316647 isoform X4 [Nasonia vitripennis]|uniref:Uncharacterized protein n=1 Tax=Nasonia vitripennis TaxID=7425 RepID=A0A7M7QSV1_NASVI|nr:uncharacterized protein LOC103316647 isoform X4 [Nasonia vitripennis]
MTKLVYTIWALILNCMGISVFKTCFSDAMEDDYGDYLLSGPPITSIIFALGVYTITSNLNFYPASFRKPIASLMGLYEFLVTAFILDFSVACVWTPIDVHIYTTFTRALCKRRGNVVVAQQVSYGNIVLRHGYRILPHHAARHEIGGLHDIF